MKKIHILFRSCAVVKVRGSSDRPFGLDKEIIILKCLKSLLESCKSLEKRVFIEIIDDSSGDDFISKMEKILSSYKVRYKINKLQCRNGGATLEYSYSLAEKSKYQLLYFCQDDYFHLKHAIPSILQAYDDKIIYDSDFCIFPADYWANYVKIKPSFVFMGKYNHWRSVDITDGTLILPKKIFIDFKEVFYKFAEFNKDKHGGEKETINKIIQENVPCIAPIESLTAHLHTTCLPSLVDWEAEIKRIKI